MLSRLDIQNFALIQKQTLDFSDGFHVITGETGAGKSILLGALQLVLGKRADVNVLFNKDEKCIVEAVFFIKNYDLKPFFEANDLDYDDETTIRRDIYPNGKSRAFVNDVPVTLQILNELSLSLIDIHSQHQTLEIVKNDFQFHILDSYANINDVLVNYQQALKTYKNNLLLLDDKQKTHQNLLKEQSFNAFLTEELLEAKITANEEVELEDELSKLRHAENILQNLSEIIQTADNDNFGIIQQLKIIKQNFNKLANYAHTYQSLNNRLEAIIIEFKDILDEVHSEINKVEVNPSRLDVLSQRLDLINQLQKKHLVHDTQGLVDVLNHLHSQTNQYEFLAEEIETLKIQLNEQKIVLKNLADDLHKQRLNFKDEVSKAVEKMIHQLGMKEAVFSIVLNQTKAFNIFGLTEIEFLIATNKGSELQKLTKTSGGELSRIVLALKSILAQKTNLPTIIFDEIDSGVSGDIANKMAEIMLDMSQNMQIIAITHLPQIASKGKIHFKVLKSNDTKKTTSTIKVLSPEDRINEIAQMISGEKITTFAQDHAKALINQF